jgi:hypothetical protein
VVNSLAAVKGHRPARSRSPRVLRSQVEEDLLVATEETGTKARRKIRTIAAWADQAMQPALGLVRLGLQRFGMVAQHW